MTKEKEITIEDLALMVQRGFTEISSKMANKKEMADGFSEVNGRLETLEHKINQIDRRLFSIEEDVVDIKTKKHTRLEERVTLIERKLGIEAAG
jgi:hypothetical protein